jgi:hypothetical protein
MGQHDQSLHPYRIFVKKTTNQPPTDGFLKISFPACGSTAYQRFHVPCAVNSDYSWSGYLKVVIDPQKM